MSERRDDLPPIERAVSDSLDELNSSMHGLVSSTAYPREFLEMLGERGHTVVPEQLLTDVLDYLGDRSAGCGYIWDALELILAKKEVTG